MTAIHEVFEGFVGQIVSILLCLGGVGWSEIGIVDNIEQCPAPELSSGFSHRAGIIIVVMELLRYFWPDFGYRCEVGCHIPGVIIQPD